MKHLLKIVNLKIENSFIMTFQKISRLLQKKSSRKQLQAAQICYYAQKEINEFFKDKEIFVISFRNQKLILEVPNSALAGEVRMAQPELLKKINLQLKQDLIKEIKTRIS